MQALGRHIYEFGAFRVDVEERRLLRDGKPVPLPPKVFDTLLVLVQNSGHLMSRDDLMKAVWRDTFVEENNLTQYISTLRKVLGDADETLIETVPRRGYRFADVVRVSNCSDLAIERHTLGRLRISEQTVEQESLLANVFASPLRIAAFAVAFVLVSAGVTAWVGSRDGSEETKIDVGAADPQALDLYRRGRELWQSREAKNLHRATTLLEEAVARDPGFALAHVALADAYAFDYRLWQKAEPAALEALRLDPSLGQPHATIGFVRMFWEWRISDAEAELKEAVRLSPDYSTARQWLAISLHANGKSGSAALIEMQKAHELEPDSPSINADLCQSFYFLRRPEEAIVQCQRALDLDPTSFNALAYLYEIYSSIGAHDEAVETFFRMEAARSLPMPSDEQAKVRSAYETGGIRAFWNAVIQAVPDNVPGHYRIARHYARLGDSQRTFDNLYRAYETRDVDFVLFLSDPAFDDLRTDSRHEKLKALLLK